MFLLPSVLYKVWSQNVFKIGKTLLMLMGKEGQGNSYLEKIQILFKLFYCLWFNTIPVFTDSAEFGFVGLRANIWWRPSRTSSTSSVTYFLSWSRSFLLFFYLYSIVFIFMYFTVLLVSNFIFIFFYFCFVICNIKCFSILIQIF